MAGISLRMANDEDPPAKYREARRRRIEMRRLASIAGTSSSPPVDSGGDGVGGAQSHKRGSRSDHAEEGKRNRRLESQFSLPAPSSSSSSRNSWAEELWRSSGRAPSVDPASIYGSMSVSGRSREMEDEISVRPDFYRQEVSGRRQLHFFAVFDGHGGSHVAALCKDRMHVFLAEELGRRETDSGGGGGPDPTAEMAAECWSVVMGRCFQRMDELALSACACGCVGVTCSCDRCGLTSDIVGSTAVVAVVGPDRIVVANCGDSRAVLSRGGRAVPLSKDHKPDRPDELARIEAAGGRVIYLNGARVLGILAMSRALGESMQTCQFGTCDQSGAICWYGLISSRPEEPWRALPPRPGEEIHAGDKYLKPIVISEPEVNVIERSPDDECLILASDGLWDVLSNDMACDVARQCLHDGSPSSTAAGILNTGSVESTGEEEEIRASRSRCSLAAALLTRLALGRKSTDNISVIVIDLKRG